MKWIKVLIQVETAEYLETTRATFEIADLINVEFGYTMQPDKLKADLKKILKAIGGKKCMVTFYIQTANEGQYPYTTVKGHRYVIEYNTIKFAPLLNGMYENWHENVSLKHIEGQILQYVENANETMLKELRTAATKVNGNLIVNY